MQYKKRQRLPRYYSIARVRKIFREIYNCNVVKIDQGYKGQRYQPYVLYQLIENDTGKVLVDMATLNALGDCLVEQGDY